MQAPAIGVSWRTLRNLPKATFRLSHLRRELADVGKGAVALCVVKSVSDHPDIGNREAEEVEIDFSLGPIRFVQQRAGPQRCRVVGREQSFEIRQRMASINDVFDKNHIFSVDAVSYVHDQAHRVGMFAFFGSVTGHRDELDPMRNGQLSGEIRQEDEGTFENADEYHHLGVRVGGVYLGCE